MHSVRYAARRSQTRQPVRRLSRAHPFAKEPVRIAEAFGRGVIDGDQLDARISSGVRTTRGTRLPEAVVRIHTIWRLCSGP